MRSFGNSLRNLVKSSHMVAGHRVNAVRTYVHGRPQVHVLYPTIFCIVKVKRDEPGTLGDILEKFTKANVNITNIESRFGKFTQEGPSFHIDFKGVEHDQSIVNLLKDVKGVPGVYSLQIMPMREVPWFPQNIRDLDLTVDTLDGGTALINEDHPGFSDKEYRSRRDKIIENAKVYRHGDQIPRVEYSDKELLTWQAVYKKLQRFRAKWACAEYQSMMPSLEKYCGYSSNNIPQLQDISDYLQQRTGFTLRPISGLLSARDFLNMLAFRVFSSTQYIRHHGNPFYTPEPDCCHELLGHIPMFADPDFADFSQEIGLASLAASEDDILRLSSVYWFTVEFGLVRGPGGAPKAYGAGLLSSFGEMEWACSENPSRECAKMGSMENMDLPTILPFDAYDAGRRKFPITTYQPAYYCVDSIGGLKQQTKHFCDSLARPFSAQYDELTQNIIVGKSITLAPRVSTADAQAASQSDYFDN